MCGICGITNFDPQMPVDRKLLQAMCDVIRHRGPDEEGFYNNGNIGLGSRRLKIIDLSTGQQPIHNEDKTVWIVFNGEIYNYRELRAQLVDKGHQFYTQTDTESIVHLYEEYGERCVDWLRGIFAFAIWDVKKKKLMLARDRVGVKQLYYRIGPGSLSFGSEIKCLLQDPSQKRSIDLMALRDFFTYLYIPGKQTIFEKIYRLPPAHLLICQNGRCSVTRYWELHPRPHQIGSEDDLMEEFRCRFREAVKLRMVSDVPLGAFLSGGIDSSAVVAEMADLSSSPVKTFTIGYEAEGISFGPYARLIAERFGTDHHELVVNPQIEDIIPTIIRSFDEPFGDSSAIPNYYISKLTREHVTVALSGLGGDEVGGGYERYLGVLVAEYYKKIPKGIREGLIGNLIKRLPDSKQGGLTIDRAKRFIAGIDCDLQERYHRYVSTFAPKELDQLFRYGMYQESKYGPFENGFAQNIRMLSTQDPLTQMIFMDFAMYLPDDLLVLTDRLSMAHSLETRVPFLDHRLLEFVATIPSNLKIRGWTKKYLLKKAFAPILPREVLWRRKKGFSVPLAVWFRGALRPFLLDWLSEVRIKRLGFFNEKMVSTLIQEHLACRHNHENKLWALLIFSIWYELYMERGRDAIS